MGRDRRRRQVPLLRQLRLVPQHLQHQPLPSGAQPLALGRRQGRQLLRQRPLLPAGRRAGRQHDPEQGELQELLVPRQVRRTALQMGQVVDQRLAQRREPEVSGAAQRGADHRRARRERRADVRSLQPRRFDRDVSRRPAQRGAGQGTHGGTGRPHEQAHDREPLADALEQPATQTPQGSDLRCQLQHQQLPPPLQGSHGGEHLLRRRGRDQDHDPLPEGHLPRTPLRVHLPQRRRLLHLRTQLEQGAQLQGGRGYELRKIPTRGQHRRAVRTGQRPDRFVQLGQRRHLLARTAGYLGLQDARFLRPHQLRLQGQVSLRSLDARRRHVALRQKGSLGLLPLGVGRLALHRRAVHGGRPPLVGQR